MKTAPILITQFDVIRSNDYVLLSLKAPTGGIVDGGLQVEEVQRVALTLAGFRSLAGLLGEMARHIDAPQTAAAPIPIKSERSFENGELTEPRDKAEPAAESVEPAPFHVLTRH